MCTETHKRTHGGVDDDEEWRLFRSIGMLLSHARLAFIQLTYWLLFEAVEWSSVFISIAVPCYFFLITRFCDVRLVFAALQSISYRVRIQSRQCFLSPPMPG